MQAPQRALVSVLFSSSPVVRCSVGDPYAVEASLMMAVRIWWDCSQQASDGVLLHELQEMRKRSCRLRAALQTGTCRSSSPPT